MNVNVPEELAARLATAAEYYRITPEEAMRRAILDFVESQEEFEKETAAWDRASARALRLVLGDGEEKWE